MISVTETSCTSRSYREPPAAGTYRLNGATGYNSRNTRDGRGWKVTQSGSATKVGYTY